jgi:hypothetical protein
LLDNSYSFNVSLDENSKVFLAGRDNPHEEAQLIEVISEPFEERDSIWNELREFVYVKYEGDIYRVLNDLSVDKLNQKMMKLVIEMIMMRMIIMIVLTIIKLKI